VYCFPLDPPGDGGGFFRQLPAARFQGPARQLVNLVEAATDADGRWEIGLVSGLRNKVAAWGGKGQKRLPCGFLGR
jgi:hypothetical protein